MKTYLIRLVQERDTAALGRMVVDWITTPPISVTTNRLGRAVFRWMDGREVSSDAMKGLRHAYPLAMHWEERRVGRGRTILGSAS